MKKLRLFSTLWQLDPRFYQLTVLSILLIYGVNTFYFAITSLSIFTIITTALLTQYAGTRLLALPHFEIGSALISSLSLNLLLRTNSLTLMILATILTIGSKFVIRWHGKHIFNPTNFGLVCMMLLTDSVWVSPGQWGHTVFLSFLIACLGGLVLTRAARSDITLAFLGFYLAILFGRALWLGDPLSIPLHQLENGAFLLFAFFMISDPKTTPDSRIGRIIFAFLVASGAGFVHFVLFRTNGLLWSLACFSLVTPVIDWLLPYTRYDWKKIS